MIEGDTWEGIAQIEITINDLVPTVGIKSARLQFRDEAGNLGKELSTENGGIVIEDVPFWILSIPEVDLGLASGIWDYDLETTNLDDFIQTCMKGTINIIQEITHD